MVSAHPLEWPRNRTRVKKAKRSRFQTRFAKARNELIEEITRLGGTHIVLSTNFELRRDGLPYAQQRTPSDPGVAVYFRLNGRDVCFACDHWTEVKDNIWAISKTINALRGIERWGVGDAMNAAFRGFEALPEPINGKVPWWETLGLSESASSTEIKAQRRKLARIYSESGTDPNSQKMAAINAAVDEGLER